MKVYWLSVLALVACTKRNPAVCCLDKADCDEAGLSEVRDCTAGLACVDHQCVVPSCSMAGCEAATPVCNITTDVCEGCTDSSNCSRFTDTDVCDTASGACVECVTASDCVAAKPVCEANACRVCKLDSECPAGACGDDGACVPEAAIVYMDPGGTDSGACTRSAPCRRFEYALTQTSVSRPHIVMQPGGYVDADVRISPDRTTASRLFIHGGGAAYSKTPGNDGGLIYFTMAATIRDLEFFAVSGGGIEFGGPESITAENIRVHGGYLAVGTSGTAVFRNFTIDGSQYGIYVASGNLTIDRASIQAGTSGIYGASSSIVTISNTLVYGTLGLAVDLPASSGTISSSTIADSGTDSGNGPRAVRCSLGLTVRSSIIWAPGGSARASIDGCNLVSTIAGPTPVPGALNMNPQFVDSANRDYHLAPNSPARDAVDSGPETDFEGDPRPRGARYDIGADEAAP